jgi:hypothetical protein
MKKQIELTAALLAFMMSATSIVNAQWSLTGNAGTKPDSNFIGTRDAKSLVFKTNGTSTTGERMRITETGNVGIGTTNPSSKLHVYGSGSASLSSNGLFTLASSSSGGPQLRFDGNTIQSTLALVLLVLV